MKLTTFNQLTELYKKANILSVMTQRITGKQSLLERLTAAVNTDRISNGELLTESLLQLAANIVKFLASDDSKSISLTNPENTLLQGFIKDIGYDLLEEVKKSQMLSHPMTVAEFRAAKKQVEDQRHAYQQLHKQLQAHYAGLIAILSKEEAALKQPLTAKNNAMVVLKSKIENIQYDQTQLTKYPNTYSQLLQTLTEEMPSLQKEIKIIMSNKILYEKLITQLEQEEKENNKKIKGNAYQYANYQEQYQQLKVAALTFTDTFTQVWQEASVYIKKENFSCETKYQKFIQSLPQTTTNNVSEQPAAILSNSMPLPSAPNDITIEKIEAIETIKTIENIGDIEKNFTEFLKLHLSQATAPLFSDEEIRYEAAAIPSAPPASSTTETPATTININVQSNNANNANNDISISVDTLQQLVATYLATPANKNKKTALLSALQLNEICHQYATNNLLTAEGLFILTSKVVQANREATSSTSNNTDTILLMQLNKLIGFDLLEQIKKLEEQSQEITLTQFKTACARSEKQRQHYQSLYDQFNIQNAKLSNTLNERINTLNVEIAQKIKEIRVIRHNLNGITLFTDALKQVQEERAQAHKSLDTRQEKMVRERKNASIPPAVRDNLQLLDERYYSLLQEVTRYQNLYKEYISQKLLFEAAIKVDQKKLKPLQELQNKLKQLQQAQNILSPVPHQTPEYAAYDNYLALAIQAFEKFIKESSSSQTALPFSLESFSCEQQRDKREQAVAISMFSAVSATSGQPALTAKSALYQL